MMALKYLDRKQGTDQGRQWTGRMSEQAWTSFLNTVQLCKPVKEQKEVVEEVHDNDWVQYLGH